MIKKLIMALLPAQYLNLLQCSKKGIWNDYFIAAESSIQCQWDNVIWPLIKDFNFDVVLELAPGVGRNTLRLCLVAKKIYAVDYNADVLNRCRDRLGSSYQGCEIVYQVNNGHDLKAIQDEAVTTIYCWDAAVHFDKSILKNYIKEFSRVLKPGGQGFIHHSNLGSQAHKDIEKNLGRRSNVNKEFFAHRCVEQKLCVLSQVDLPWGDRLVDCITIFKK